MEICFTLAPDWDSNLNVLTDRFRFKCQDILRYCGNRAKWNGTKLVFKSVYFLSHFWCGYVVCSIAYAGQWVWLSLRVWEEVGGGGEGRQTGR